MLLPLIIAGGLKPRVRAWVFGVPLLVTAGGYYAVYLLTPWDLAWHLDTSLVRLLLQLWPAGLLLWCVALPVIPAGQGFAVRHPGRAAWVVVNGVLAALLLFLSSRQLASNEFAAARVEGARTSVVLGDGWFAPETDGRARWAWSRGESLVYLHRAAGGATRLSLRFRTRGLGRRNVSASVGGVIIWRQPVGEDLRDAEIRDLPVAEGITAIRFSTDTPGMLESPAPGARALTFAIYDPVLRGDMDAPPDQAR
jgi:hypothetical protein